jgi:hypothetical protein
MKSLIFKNGESLEFLDMYQTNEHVYGTVRDVLDFRFNPEQSLDKISELFSKENCKNLIVRYSEKTVSIDGEEQDSYSDNVYHNYNIILSLSKALYLPISQTQISVRVAAMTETELRLEELENSAGGVPEEELNNSYNEGVNSL